MIFINRRFLTGSWISFFRSGFPLKLFITNTLMGSLCRDLIFKKWFVVFRVVDKNKPQMKNHMSA